MVPISWPCDLPTLASQSAGLVFVFLVEMVFCYFGPATLELLASSNPPALASQSVGITGVSHQAVSLVNLKEGHGTCFNATILEQHRKEKPSTAL